MCEAYDQLAQAAGHTQPDNKVWAVPVSPRDSWLRCGTEREARSCRVRTVLEGRLMGCAACMDGGRGGGPHIAYRWVRVVRVRRGHDAEVLTGSNDLFCQPSRGLSTLQKPLSSQVGVS